MKKIPENFNPTEQSLNNLKRHGVLPDFVEYELPNFITYWQETGKKKKSWQMTLQVWMKRAHQGRAGREWEENRHIRERYNTGRKDDLFDSVLDSINGSGKDVKHPQVSRPIGAAAAYRLPDPPEKGKPMSPDEAFAQLRQSGVIK